jgi:hypothetical protein
MYIYVHVLTLILINVFSSLFFSIRFIIELLCSCCGAVFQRAYAFNGDVSKWNVTTNNIDLLRMFADATSFTQKFCNPTMDGIIGAGDFILTPDPNQDYITKPGKGIMRCCPSGKYNIPKSGSTDYETDYPYIFCHSCNPGYFTSNKNIDLTCKSCPTGWYQDGSGTAFCLPCNAGLYQSEEAQLFCNNCPKAYYTDQSKQTVCKTCGIEETSEERSTFCTKCPVGEYMSTNRVCTGCP